MSDIYTNASLSKLADEHNQLFDGYSISMRNADELQQLELPKFSAAGEIPELEQALTPENTPATEVAKSLSLVNGRVTLIQKLESEIDSHREAIEKIKSQVMWMIILVIGLIIVGFFVLLSAIR